MYTVTRLHTSSFTIVVGAPTAPIPKVAMSSRHHIHDEPGKEHKRVHYTPSTKPGSSSGTSHHKRSPSSHPRSTRESESASSHSSDRSAPRRSTPPMSYTTEVEQWRSRFTDLQTNLETANARIEGLTIQNQEADNQLTESQQENRNLRKKYAEAVMREQALEREISELRTRLQNPVTSSTTGSNTSSHRSRDVERETRRLTPPSSRKSDDRTSRSQKEPGTKASRRSVSQIRTLSSDTRSRLDRPRSGIWQDGQTSPLYRPEPTIDMHPNPFLPASTIATTPRTMPAVSVMPATTAYSTSSIRYTTAPQDQSSHHGGRGRDGMYQPHPV